MFIKKIIMKKHIKRIRRILTILVLILVPLSAWSQTKTFKLEDIASRTWAIQEMADIAFWDQYNESEIISFLDGKIAGYDEYYLSDSIPTSFDKNKVGMINEGKYIVRRASKKASKEKIDHKTFSVLEIIELSETDLVLSNLKDGSNYIRYKLR